MAASKFGAKLHKSTHKIVVVLVYALLEWVLITLLLFNSMFYYLIKKFASFFGLKPTCLWCSSVDSLFEPGKKDGSYEGIFCEDHTSQISNLGYCLSHKKLAKTQNRCQECSNINGVDTASEDGIEKELACSCCEKSFRSDVPPHLMISGLLDVVPKERLRTDEGCNMSNEEPQILSDVGSLNLQEAAEEDSSRSTANSLCNEDEEDTCDVEVEPTEAISSSADHLTAANDQFHHESVLTETSDSCNSDLKNQDLAVRYEEGLLIGNETLDDHPGEKHNEDHELDNGGNEGGKIDDPGLVIEQLRSELESERSAAAIAANQTMAMITRLQEEKAAIKMEAVQYQRMMEEQAEYDQEALQLLNELVIKREKEKQELREKVLDYEGIRKRGCSSSSCSPSDDSEKLSIDLNREIGEDTLPSTGAVLESVDLVLDRVKNWNMLDGSLEEERVSILHQLKELEEKLFSICDDDQQQEELLFENADLCSAEVNLGPPSSGCLAMEKDHPSTMCSAAKKLLPFLDGKAREVETSDHVVAIMKEMDHVYGRLQALEADREFLRQCIASLNKGDKGVGLLQEILQHLRELRNADTCHLIICNAQESS